MVKVKVKTLSGYTGLRLPGLTYNETDKRAAWLKEKGLISIEGTEPDKITGKGKKAVKTAKNAPKKKSTTTPRKRAPRTTKKKS